MGVQTWNVNAKHRAVQLELLQKIAYGEWKVNELIPSLDTIKKMYEGRYSYGVVRKAIDILIEDDCLEAKNGTGMYVTANAEVIIQNLIEQILGKVKKDLEILHSLNILKTEVFKLVDSVFV